MHDLILFLFKSIVKNEDKLKVELISSENPGVESYNISIDKEEIAKIIGKNGSVIKALRTVAGISAKNQGKFLRLNLQEV